MQVKHLLLGIFAVGVTAIANPEAGNDIEARDFQGESLNEFDVRSPEEEEFDVRDEEDLEARGGKPKCRGDHVEWKKVGYKWECVCTRSGEVYNKWKGCECEHGKEYSDKYNKCIPDCKWGEEYDDKTGKCEKPFKCKGDHVKIETDYSGKKTCVCEREGEVYNKWKGCECEHGKEFSEKYNKCIPDCKYGEEYDDKTGKCERPFKCKGDHVKIETDYNGKKTCVCEREGEVYNKWKGCECEHGKEFSEKYNKCIPDCKYGEEYDDKTGKCEKPFSCKGRNVEIKEGNDGKKYCHCTLSGQEYNDKYGCSCKRGEYFSKKWNKCIEKCKYGEEYGEHGCAPICKGDHVIYKHDECKCLKHGQYYDKEHGCKDRCLQGAWYKHGKCQCKEGQYYDHKEGCKDRCVGEHVFYKHGKCQCKERDQYYDKTKGCVDRCDGDAKYDWHKKECKCDKGEKYVKGTGCVKQCKHPAVLEYDQCKCPGDQVYSDWKGCQCPKRGQEFSKKYQKCYYPCHKKNEELSWKWGKPKCVCKKGYVPTKWGCQKKKNDGGYGGY